MFNEHPNIMYPTHDLILCPTYHLMSCMYHHLYVGHSLQEIFILREGRMNRIPDLVIWPS